MFALVYRLFVQHQQHRCSIYTHNISIKVVMHRQCNAIYIYLWLVFSNCQCVYVLIFKCFKLLIAIIKLWSDLKTDTYMQHRYSIIVLWRCSFENSKIIELLFIKFKLHLEWIQHTKAKRTKLLNRMAIWTLQTLSYGLLQFKLHTIP